MPAPANWTPTPGSSNVSAVAYDPDAQLLHVRFNSGHQYAFTNVPEDVHSSFLNADSAGKFFHENIKGQYDYKRIG
jgi:hypothetical protein